MIYKRNASDFMTPDVIVAGKNNTFEQVMDFFITYKIQHLPVVSDDILIGILTVNDVLRFLAGKLGEGKALNMAVLNNIFHVDEVMTPEPVIVTPDTSQRTVLDILGAGNFQAVPVVEDGKVKGIITNKDIARIYNYDITHVL